MKSIEIDELSMAIAGNNILRREFRLSLRDAPEGFFVERPESIKLTANLRREKIKGIRTLNERYANDIQSRTIALKNAAPNIDNLKAFDLASKSLLWESQLRRNGAVFGDYSWNFLLSDLRLPKIQIESLENAALGAFQTIISTNDVAKEPASQSAVQQYINSFRLTPNGARVDIILTPSGPKVIEVNLDWVDGIQALCAFQKVTAGKTNDAPIKKLIETFKTSKNLAILNLAAGFGSRETGPIKELELLAQTLRDQNRFASVVCLNPWQTATNYLNNFDGFYINGDPQMIRTDAIPEWLKVVMEKTRSKLTTVFPAWRPALDRKAVLVLASNMSGTFPYTLPYSVESLISMGQTGRGFYLKGDLYSSKKVAKSNTPEFDELSADAIMFPGDYVLQEEAQSIDIEPTIGFDSSSSRPVYIIKPKCKFNVWIINGDVVGVLASISPNSIISDRDFNIVPKPI